MILIIEGPDGAGKTTLARAIGKEIDTKYIHNGVPARGTTPVQYYAETAVQLFDSALLSPEIDVIIDRSFPSEMVYGKHTHTGDLIKDEARTYLKLCRHLRVGILVCLPEWNVVVNNWSKRPEFELLKTEARLFDVYQHYQRLVARHSLATFDYTSNSVINLLKGKKELYGYCF